MIYSVEEEALEIYVRNSQNNLSSDKNIVRLTAIIHGF